MTIKATLEQFVKRSNVIHNNEYDYSKSIYIDSQTKLIITCKVHGDFEQRPAKHTGGQGCPVCRYIKSGNKLKQNNDTFLIKAKKAHSDKYEYLEEVNGSKNYISIKCLKCNNVFSQIPNAHLMGHGCPVCGSINSGLSKRLEQDDFIKRCKEIHGDLYNYSKVFYKIGCEKIDIFCNRCKKIFSQFAHFHLYNASGCPDCAKKTSKEEKQVVDFIKSIYDKTIIENTRKIIPPFELDIYIPDRSFAIEYNGLVWHTEEHVGKQCHYNKSTKCSEKEIQLFHIFSDEWREKKEIIKSMIKYRLGLVEQKIHARKCEFDIISRKEGKDFFESAHISGDTQSQIYLSLKFNNEIVCCLSLRKPIQSKYENCIEIARFANKLNTTVSGGFQKLFERAIEYAHENNFKQILTYSDLRFGEGNVYAKSGFNLIGKTGLDYWYTNGWKREFRFKYRADSINNLSEKQVAELAGVKKIYGCGSKIWLKKL